jgi:membrane dipeptidase
MSAQGIAHLNHFADLIGWDAIGIGSDVDSGFGRDETAVDIDNVEEWSRVGALVPASARSGVLGENWLRFLSQTLP